MQGQSISFKSQDSTLEGLLFDAESNAGVVILRGGANIPNSQSDNPAWQKYLAENGISSLSFDFRGVGNREVELASTNIKTRVEDAITAIEALKKETGCEKIYVIGVSMGGPVALRCSNQAEGIFLVSPAAYSKEAEAKNFGPDFSGAIRKPNSWKNSPDFEIARNYKGALLIAYGEKDAVIPPEVLDKYAEIIKSKDGEVLKLNAEHSFIRLDDSESISARNKVYKKIAEIISRGSKYS